MRHLFIFPNESPQEGSVPKISFLCLRKANGRKQQINISQGSIQLDHDLIVHELPVSGDRAGRQLFYCLFLSFSGR